MKYLKRIIQNKFSTEMFGVFHDVLVISTLFCSLNIYTLLNLKQM